MNKGKKAPQKEYPKKEKEEKRKKFIQMIDRFSRHKDKIHELYPERERVSENIEVS